MKTNARLALMGAMLVLSLVLTACGGNQGGGAASGGGGAPPAPATVDIGSKGEELAFDKTALTAAPGQSVTVNFKNNSAAQQHNWILVKGGAAVADPLAAAGAAAGPGANYLPADKANVIAETALTDAGKTNSVTFTAPAAGEYMFICTVPGHSALMKGTLTVK